MRKRGYILGAAAALLIAAAGTGVLWFYPYLNLPFSKTHCESVLSYSSDPELVQAALRFVTEIVDGNADAAYAGLTADARAATRPAKLRQNIHDIIAPAGPLSDFNLTEMYKINVAFGPQRIRAMCARSTEPDDQIAVVVTSAARQAYVILEAHAKTMDWTFVLWLVDEKGWRIQALNVSPMKLAGRSAGDTWQLARDERNRNHTFNATILYIVAIQLADRGPNFHLALQQHIQDELAQLAVPHELQGRLPVTWKFAGPDNYKIVWIGATAFNDKIYLSMAQEMEPWPADQEAERRNRQLIAELGRAFPEYSSAFGGMTVTARDAGGGHLYQTTVPPVIAPP
jgi:hypothetical protein